MKSSRKDIVIGFILIIALVGGIFFYKNLKTPKVLPTSTPLTIKSKIEGLFNYVIPDDLDSIELKDVTGGIYRGIAARKFEKRIFTITVLADLPDLSSNEFYEFYVKDNGQGISKKDHAKIFKLFETTDNKSTGESSTGVGLNLLKMLVEEQGGKIRVESSPDLGSTFFFEWRK